MLLDTRDAAARAGVKPQTLYAYVSRGLLTRRRGPDGRSLFSTEELDRLSAGRRAPGPWRPEITTALTLVSGGRTWYRGVDASDLAGVRPFERVAEWLWTAAVAVATPVWRGHPVLSDRARRAQRVLPEDTHPIARLEATAALLRSGGDDEPGEVLAVLVDALPPLRRRTPLVAPVARRLWDRLCGQDPSPEGVRALDAALVLWADAGVDEAALACRLAATSTQGLAAPLAAGIATVPIRDPEIAGVRSLLARIDDPSRAVAVVSEAVRRDEQVSGFADRAVSDERALTLLRQLDTIDSPRSDVVRATADAARRIGLRPLPSFALGALAHCAHMVSGGATALVTVARCAGWIAHAREERSRGSGVRPRAGYDGPPPPVRWPAAEPPPALRSVVDYLSR